MNTWSLRSVSLVKWQAPGSMRDGVSSCSIQSDRGRHLMLTSDFYTLMYIPLTCIHTPNFLTLIVFLLCFIQYVVYVGAEKAEECWYTHNLSEKDSHCMGSPLAGLLSERTLSHVWSIIFQINYRPRNVKERHKKRYTKCFEALGFI